MQPHKFICISDAHLGETASLLNSDEGIEVLAECLAKIAPAGARNLVLAGDITDQVLAASSEYGPRTQALIEGMAGALPALEKIILLFGNHDLALLRKHLCNNAAVSKFFVHGLSCEDNPNAMKIKRLVFPSSVKVPFQLANPIYITQTGRRTYIFHHGHHVRNDVNVGWDVFKLGQRMGLWKKLIHTDVEFGEPEPAHAETLEEFENGTFPFVTTFWKNDQDESVPPEERIWRWLHKISKPVSRPRSVKPGCRRVRDFKTVPGISASSRNRVYKKYLPSLKSSSNVVLPPGKEISFIFGDTHEGGYVQRGKGKNKIRLYNTGAWVTYNPEHHPCCLIYVANDEEEEHLYEVGFEPRMLQSCGRTMADVSDPAALGLDLNPVERELISQLWPGR